MTTWQWSVIVAIVRTILANKELRVAYKDVKLFEEVIKREQ